MTSKSEGQYRRLLQRPLASALVAAIGMAAALGSCALTARAGDEANKALEGISFSGVAYIDYANGQTPLDSGKTKDYNRFTLTRGYFTLKKKIAPWLGMRLTTDLTQDATGDYKVRQKYFYAELRPHDQGPLTDIVAEVGLGHIPWLDFEEHINPYRCQGTMAIERAGVLNSADLGVNLRGYFGGKLADAEKTTGSKHYSGRYGSWHVGIYNGGGYHAPENNENKALEGRLTLRPLPDVVPGLQLSYFGVFGKGNTYSAAPKEYPDYQVNLGMLSFEHPMIVLAAQYFATEGNAKGAWIDADTTKDALSTLGFSFFGNVHLPGTQDRLSVFGRLDYFDVDRDHVLADKTAYVMSQGGLAYRLYLENMVLITYEATEFEKDVAGKGKPPSRGYKAKDDQRIQAVFQLAF
jgi:hypothetical protein